MVAPPGSRDVARGDIWLVALDPTIGSEIQKTRPCLVVSPPEMNNGLRTVIVAPMTIGSRPAPFRIDIEFEGKTGLVLLDQMRSVDKRRLVRLLGSAKSRPMAATLDCLCAMFAA